MNNIVQNLTVILIVLMSLSFVIKKMKIYFYQNKSQKNSDIESQKMCKKSCGGCK